MKKSVHHFLGIFLTLLTFQLSAQTNNMVIFTQESKPFYVVLNGIRQNMEPETNVKIKDLKGEHYKVKVIFADGQTPDIDKGVSYLEMGKEISMEIIDKRGKYKLRYAGEIDLEQSVSTDNQSEVSYHDYEYTEEDWNNVQNNSGQTSHQSTTSTSVGDNGSASSTVNSNGSSTTTTSQGGNGSASININVTETGVSMDTQVNDGTSSSTTTTNTNVNSGSTGTNTTSVTSSSVNYTGFMANGTMCSSPSMSSKVFLDFKYDIEAENMFSREEMILNTFKNNCMTSQQVADIIKIDYPTVDAEKIGKQGYRYTWDTENYGIVINAIKSSLKRQEVAKFLNLSQGDVQVVTSHSQSTSSSTSENYDYSSDDNSSTDNTQYETDDYVSLVNGYSGTIGCIDGLLADENSIKKAADNESFSEEKLSVIKQASKNKCFSTDQLIHIASTFSFEKDIVSFAKWAYNKTYDIDDYYKLNELFSFSSSKNELDKYIQSQPDKGYGSAYSSSSSAGVAVPNYSGNIGCFDPVIDGDKVKKMVDNESFSDEKLTVVKQALKNKCITVSQFKNIASSFSFEKDIIEFAKMAYPKTYDQDNFYEVNEILTHGSSKKELDKIIK